MNFDIPDTAYSPLPLDVWYRIAQSMSHADDGTDDIQEFIQRFKYPPAALFFSARDKLLHKLLNQWVYMMPAVISAGETCPKFLASEWTEILDISSVGPDAFFGPSQRTGEIEDRSREVATGWVKRFFPDRGRMTTPDVDNIPDHEWAQLQLCEVTHLNFMDELQYVDAEMGVRRSRGEVQRLQAILFPSDGTDTGLAGHHPANIRAMLALHAFIDKWTEDKPAIWNPPADAEDTEDRVAVIRWEIYVVFYYLTCVHTYIERRPSIPHRRRDNE